MKKLVILGLMALSQLTLASDRPDFIVCDKLNIFTDNTTRVIFAKREGQIPTVYDMRVFKSVSCGNGCSQLQNQFTKAALLKVQSNDENIIASPDDFNPKVIINREKETCKIRAKNPNFRFNGKLVNIQ